MTDFSPSHRGALAAALLLAFALSGCRDSDVVAKVGSTKIHSRELRAFTRGPATPAALDALVERALLAEFARREGLADDPEIRARLAEADREVLAQAAIEHATAGATSETALRKRYQTESAQLARRVVHVAQIFVRAPQGQNEQEAREKANRVYASAVSAPSFAELARKSSDDPVSAAKGGDLGQLLEGEVDAGIFEAAAGLKIGEVSRPVRSSFGYHIFKALEAPKTETPPFEKARGALAAKATREAIDRLTAELKKQISVTTFPERVAAGGGR